METTDVRHVSPVKSETPKASINIYRNLFIFTLAVPFGICNQCYGLAKYYGKPAGPGLIA